MICNNFGLRYGATILGYDMVQQVRKPVRKHYIRYYCKERFVLNRPLGSLPIIITGQCRDSTTSRALPQKLSSEQLSRHEYCPLLSFVCQRSRRGTIFRNDIRAQAVLSPTSFSYHELRDFSHLQRCNIQTKHTQGVQIRANC